MVGSLAWPFVLLQSSLLVKKKQTFYGLGAQPLLLSFVFLLWDDLGSDAKYT